MKIRNEHFYSFKNGVKVDDASLQKMIDETTNKMISGETGDHYYTAIGNSLVAGIRFEDEIALFVTQDFKEATILLDKDGKWRPINYRYERMIEELRREEPLYNPRKEV